MKDRYDHSIDLTQSPEAVWAFTTDLARTPEWRTTITSIDPPDELKVGAPFSGTTRLLGRTWQWNLRVTVVDPNRRFVYEVVKGVAKPSVGYLFEPTSTGCRFTMSGWIEHKTLAARLLMPLALPALNRETAKHLANLARIHNDHA